MRRKERQFVPGAARFRQAMSKTRDIAVIAVKLAPRCNRVRVSLISSNNQGELELGMSLSLHHTGKTTTRYSELVTFYTVVLGAKIVRESEWEQGQHELDARTGLEDSAGRVALLKFGTGYFEIIEFSSPRRAPSTPPILADTGLTHFALSCDDCVAEYQRLLDAGMQFNAPPWRTPAGGIFTFGHDPDGNIIELLQPAPSAIS